MVATASWSGAFTMLNESQRAKLRKARERAGLTVRQAAAAAKISHSSWAHIETGRRASDLATIRRMALVVGLELRVDLVRKR